MTTTNTSTDTQPRPWWRKKRHMAWCLPASLLIVFAAIGSLSEEPIETAPAPAPATVAPDMAAVDEPDQAAVDEAEARLDEAIAEAEELAEDVTVGQRNAVQTAQDYLDYQGFSKQGLADQLEYEGFADDEIAYAIGFLDEDVSWREQAVRVAEDYLDYQAFSRAGLIEQLQYEGFTKKQATYAADKVGL